MNKGQRQMLITVRSKTAQLLRYWAKDDFRTIDAEIEWLVEMERKRRMDAFGKEWDEAKAINTEE